MDDAEIRGSLEIRSRVVTRIAEHAALTTTGVVKDSSSLEHPFARTLPRVTAALDGSRVRLTVDVAVTWPCAVEEVAARVRSRIRSETARLTGLEVRSTHVCVHVVSGPATRLSA